MSRSGHFASTVAKAMADALPDAWTEEEATGLVASYRRAAAVLCDDLEPALRHYEGGELTAILEAATELREQLGSRGEGSPQGARRDEEIRVTNDGR